MNITTSKKGGIFFQISASDFTKNFKNLGTAIKWMYAKTLAGVLIDILANSQPRVPYDTGKLRRSGMAVIYGGKSGRGKQMIVGGGKEDGTVVSQLHTLRYDQVRIMKFMRGVVGYYRMADRDPNFDVALFTHEILYPYEMRFSGHKPAARKPNTGPKYLELAFKENKDLYIEAFRSVLRSKWFERNIKVLQVIKKKPTGLFSVDLVDIVINRMKQLGGYTKTLKKYAGVH